MGWTADLMAQINWLYNFSIKFVDDYCQGSSSGLFFQCLECLQRRFEMLKWFFYFVLNEDRKLYNRSVAKDDSKSWFKMNFNSEADCEYCVSIM